MKSFQHAFAIVTVVSLMAIPIDAQAGGSWGGSSGGGHASSGGGASRGGSSGGGFFSRLRARHSGGSQGGSSGGSSGGSYRASYASSGGSSGGSPRMGPLRRLAAKIHARKAARHSSGSSGGSSGRYSGGSSGGRASYASYSRGSTGGSSGGSSGNASLTSYSSYSAPAVHSVSMGSAASYESAVIESSYESYTPMGETIIDGGYSTGETIIDNGYSSGGTIIDGGYESGESIIDYGASSSVPSSDAVAATAASYTVGSPQRHESAKPVVDPDAAMLTVKVPFEAVVTVNDHETESDGSVRQFMSRGLKEGYVYTYVVKVVYEVEGEEKTDSKSVKLRPGDFEHVEFEGLKAAGTDSVQARKVPVSDDLVTVVQLHVPSEAKVSLAGNATNGSGPVRTFRTKQLKVGQQWTDYTVRVTAIVDGQSVTKERTVDVKAGSVTELDFDFDEGTIAIR